MEPQVSVIISTKNEEKNIARCLQSVRDQIFPKNRIEIVVVDNFSPDRTFEIAKNFTPLVFSHGPERSAQRNFGVGKSRGEYILYLDADMRLDPGVIGECVECMSEQPDVIALYIPEIMEGESFFARVRRFERSFYDGTVVDAVRFIRKGGFQKIGGFDERLWAAEDWDITKRLKKLGKFDIIRSALYHNEREFSLGGYLSGKRYYLDNLEIYTKKWGKNDADVKKQFGFFYRYFGIFLENGKWKRLMAHPVRAFGVYFLRFLTGFEYLISLAKK